MDKVSYQSLIDGCNSDGSSSPVDDDNGGRKRKRNDASASSSQHRCEETTENTAGMHPHPTASPGISEQHMKLLNKLLKENTDLKSQLKERDREIAALRRELEREKQRGQRGDDGSQSFDNAAMVASSDVMRNRSSGFDESTDEEVQLSSNSIQNNGKASPNGVEQLISASLTMGNNNTKENTQTKSKLPRLSWDEKYEILKGLCDFIHKEFQKEMKTDNVNYTPDVKIKLQDFIGRPSERCDCLPGRRKLTYRDAIILSTGENEEEEAAMHKVTQIKDWLKNMRRTGQKIPEEKEQLLKDLCVDVLSR